MVSATVSPAVSPAVSIAIRAYRRRWLPDAIRSVLGQTFTNLELVIYDDAGDLEDVARAAADARVVYHRAGQRFQASGRFREAVTRCRGRYIGVLDDDDRYEPAFIARLVDALDRDPGAGIAFCRTTWDAGGTRSTPRDRRPPGRQRSVAEDMLRWGWTVSPSHMLIRREGLEAASQALPMPDGVAPDVFINIGVALAGWAHVLVDAPLVICGWHRGQISRTMPTAADTAIATWRLMALPDPVLARLRDRRLARALLVRALEQVARGETAAAREDLREAAGMAPDDWRSERRQVALAAWTGTMGSLAARAWLRWSPRGRRRAGPPVTIGDR